MSDLEEIDNGLAAGLRASESLITWMTGAEGHRQASYFRTQCEAGQQALARLRQSIHDGKRYIEVPEREAPTCCYCAATPHPPCGFCESGQGGDE